MFCFDNVFEYDNDFNGVGFKIGVVMSCFNLLVCEGLFLVCVIELKCFGVVDVDIVIVNVLGVLEILLVL